MTHKDDLHPIVNEVGTGFSAAYRVPWGVRNLLDEDRKFKRFDSWCDAYVAGTKAMCAELQDPTRGFFPEVTKQAIIDAERFFKKVNNEG